jgi:hypothetical protein
MTKPTSTDRIESARKILNASPSTVAQLEAARAALTHVLAEGDAEVEEMRRRRKTIAASDASIAEIEKALKRHDADVLVLTDRNDIAAAVAAKLDERIAADREVARAAKRQGNYDAALKLHVATTDLVRELLDRFGPESRKVMRLYAEWNRKPRPPTATCRLARSLFRLSKLRGVVSFGRGKRRCASSRRLSTAGDLSPSRATFRPLSARTGSGTSSCRAGPQGAEITSCVRLKTTSRQ